MDKQIEEYIEILSTYTGETFKRIVSQNLITKDQFKKQTPIEKIMNLALWCEFFDMLPWATEIEQQKQLGDYRVDFLLTTMNIEGKKVSIVIECDGHDFHEKTKEQASRDKKRDRELQKMGYPVFRFSGSDIWNKPIYCATEVFDYVREKFVSK